MGNNIIKLADGTELLNISNDTVSAGSVLSGVTFHDKKGNAGSGSIESKSNSDVIISGNEVAIPSGFFPSGFSVFTEGGTLPKGLKLFAKGVYSLSRDSAGGTSFTVTHNLGEVPDMFMFYAPANVASTYSMLWTIRWNVIGLWRGSSTYQGLTSYHGNSTSSVTTTNQSTNSYGVKAITATTATVTTYSNSGSYYWRAGTYEWIAIKFS